MSLSYIEVAAFADRPDAGNPAAVCLLPQPADAVWMQTVAREQTALETAFLIHRPDGAFDLRWFVPEGESDLCGHATLASAHVLWQEGLLPPEAPARFHTRSGLLTATRSGDGIELDFPVTPVTLLEEPAGLAQALGIRPRTVWQSHPAHGDQFHFLVEVGSEAALRSLTPDFDALRRLPAVAVIVTSPATTPGYDFLSRFFAPKGGIDEDPVTGSAHCVLGPYWQPRLGKDAFIAYQASARGGVVRVRIVGERVVLGGQAVTIRLRALA